MICPRCQTRNELGASGCANCGAPFTRQAARRVRPEPGGRRHDYNYHQPVANQASGTASFPRQGRPGARRQPRTYRRGAGPGNRAIGGLIAFLIITIVIISGAALLGSGDTSTRISEGLSGGVGAIVGSGDGEDEPNVEVPETPPEPQGEQTWTLTQDELNRRLAAQEGAFGPADDVSVELGDGTVKVTFQAYGASGTYHGTLTAQDGVPVVADSTIDGALGWVVSSDRIDEALNREMAAVVQEQQVSVESVHVRPGEMVFGISG